MLDCGNNTMNDDLLQQILGWTFVVGSIDVVVGLFVLCCGLVSEIEGWRKSVKFFSSVLKVLSAIAFMVICTAGIIALFVLFNKIYCDFICVY